MCWSWYYCKFVNKSSKGKNIEGLTIFDAEKLKANFKGSKINEVKGAKVDVEWKISELKNNSISF